MNNFLQHFGQEQADAPDGYAFSNVRSGLIVGLVSYTTLTGRSRYD